LRNEVQARGVDPAPARLCAASRVEADHLSRLQLADLALDPFPYNSHSTGIDVLWAGVPMVALAGRYLSWTGWRQPAARSRPRRTDREHCV
jgi:protein O-GlcNAc transferase